MAEQDSTTPAPTDPPQSPSVPEAGAADAAPPPAPPPPAAQPQRRWLRRTLIGVGALVVLLVAITLLAPTIASIGPVRSFVIGKVNDQLNGRVDIADWSLGWTSGIAITGIKVYDATNALILEVPRFKTDLTLLNAIRGNYALGDTVADVNFTQLKIDEQGRTNYQKLVKTSPADPAATPDATKQPTAQEQTTLPDVRGKLTLNILGGTIQGPPAQTPQGTTLPVVHLQPGSIHATITSINEPINHAIKLAFRTRAGDAGGFEASGAVDIADSHVLSEPPTGSETLRIAALNLGALAPLLKAIVPDQQIDLGGIVNGELTADVKSATTLAASGQIVVDNVLVGGDPLQGDTFRTRRLTLNVDTSRDAIDADTTKLSVRTLSVTTPEMTATVTSDVAEQSLQRLAAGQAPGYPGQLTVDVNVTDLSLLNQLRNTLQLEEDVQITGGTLREVVTVQLQPESATLSQSLDLAAQGTRSGKPIELRPITLNAGATAWPAPGGTAPDLRDLSLELESEFANATGGGATLGSLDLVGDFNLDRFTAELSQFADLGGLDLAGTGEFEVASSGDPTRAGEPIDATANVTVGRLRVAGIDDQPPIDVERLVFDAAARLQGSEASPVERVNVSKLTLQTFTQGIREPTIDLSATADAILGEELAVPSFALQRLSIPSLLRAQRQFGAFVPALQEQQLDLTGGSLSATAAGSYTDGTATLAQPLVVSVKALTLTKEGRPVLRNESLDATVHGSVSLADDTMAQTSAEFNSDFANLTLEDARLKLSGPDDRPVDTFDLVQQAVVTVETPDLARLYALVQALQPPATQPAAPPADGEEPLPPLEVRSGSMLARIDVRDDGPTTAVNVSDFRVSNLSLARGNSEYAFGRDLTLTVSAALDASAPSGATTQQAQALRITEFNGDFVLATVSLAEPFAVTNLAGDAPTANGAIKVTGAFETLAPLLAVLEGKPADAYPYQGQYAMTQNVATSGKVISLRGELAADDFRVLEAGRVAFAEKRLTLANDIDINTSEQWAAIKSITLAMPGSDALHVDVTGRVNQYQTERQLENVRVGLSYDLEKLWPLVKPLLTTPEEPDAYKDTRVAGTFKRQIALSGTYPAGLPFNEAIKTVSADGGLAFGVVAHQGIQVENLDIPFKLRRGNLYLVEAPPADFNGGTLKLAGLEVDLAQEVPRLSSPKNFAIVDNATINPLLGETLGKYVNPVFVGASRAQGLLDVTLVECRKLALDAEVIKTAESGRAVIAFSLTQMDIANPLGSIVLGELNNSLSRLGIQGVSPDKGVADVYRGEIRDAVVTIDGGVTEPQMTLWVVDPGRAADVIAARDPGAVADAKPLPFTFSGTINLATLNQNLQVGFPTDLAIRGLRGETAEVLKEAFPQTIPLTFRGATTATKVALADTAWRGLQNYVQNRLIRELGGKEGEKIGEALDQILGGRRTPPPPQPRPREDPPPSEPSGSDRISRPREEPRR